MSFFVRPEPAENCFGTVACPATFIDILYDFRRFLDDHDGFLGPHAVPDGKKVAIIGSGPAGLMAARLLMKMGVNPVIYEAGDRYGGRVWSLHPLEGDAALFEMGAMRIPRSEQLFQYLASQFGMTHQLFPDPGVVDTEIYYQGRAYPWKAGGQPPVIFEKVSKDWNLFVETHLGPVREALLGKEYDKAGRLWQEKLTGSDTEWTNISFFRGLQRAFPDWGVDEFSLFGALGLGSGGFGPLYSVNFAEIARLVINGLETCQQFYPNGMEELVDGLYRQKTKVRHRDECLSLEDLGCLRYQTTVRSVRPKDVGVVQVITECRQKGEGSRLNDRFRVEDYDAVIVATTTRSMEIDMGMTNSSGHEIPPLNEYASNGLRKAHLMNSSKLFALTKTKFWQGRDGEGLPENIQTDELCRGLYCLDYPESDYGVVLVSYTWGDDSTKLLAIKDVEQRFLVLMDSLGRICPRMAEKLIEEKIAVKNVDWELEPYYYGAFKLNQPGQDVWNQSMYYQFLSVLDNKEDTGVYLAGDSVSWSGGWIEGALQTGMNAAAAVVYRLAGKSNLYHENPLTQNPALFDYTTRE